MSNYRKLAAALIGIATLIASRYGLDLSPLNSVMVDGIVAALTLYGVWQLPNEKRIF